MKFVDFNGSISNDTLLQLSAMEQIDPPCKGKESIATTHGSKVFVFTPTSESNYCVRYFKGIHQGKFHNGVCKSEDEVMQIIADLKKAEDNLDEESVLQTAQTKYGCYSKTK